MFEPGEPPFYHGVLDRAETEGRLEAGMKRYPGQKVFLVRKSPKKIDSADFVLSFTAELHRDLPPTILHLVITAHLNDWNFPMYYTLECKVPQSFATLEDLIANYKDPSGGPPGPIGIYVPYQDAAFHEREPEPALPQPVARPAAAEPLSLPAMVGAQLVEPPTVDEQLLCEGYLLKKRGVGQTRKRWFRLSTKKLAYFTKDAGELIACVAHKDIAAITDQGKAEFRVVTKEAFGTSNTMDVTLEAPNQRVKNKWLSALRAEDNFGGGFRQTPGLLVIEGNLAKIKDFGSANKTRWFVLTDETFSYLKEEAGEIMGSVSLDSITTVAPGQDVRSFRVISNTRFTVGGSYEVLLRADSEAVKNKWIQAFRVVLPSSKFAG